MTLDDTNHERMLEQIAKLSLRYDDLLTEINGLYGALANWEIPLTTVEEILAEIIERYA